MSIYNILRLKQHRLWSSQSQVSAPVYSPQTANSRYIPTCFQSTSVSTSPIPRAEFSLRTSHFASHIRFLPRLRQSRRPISSSGHVISLVSANGAYTLRLVADCHPVTRPPRSDLMGPTHSDPRQTVIRPTPRE